MSYPAVPRIPHKGAGLPHGLYQARAIRDLDARLIAVHAGGGFGLMQKAARVAFRHGLRQWPSARAWLIFCGGGNNGGDGYLVASQAVAQGFAAHCVALTEPAALQGDARRAYEEALQSGAVISSADDLTETGGLSGLIGEADLIVDAMLGTGLTGELRPLYRDVAAAINGAIKAVLAVDIPSGLCSDTGARLGDAVSADLTVTFIGLKPGLFTGKGPEVAGRVVFESLGCPAGIYAEVPVTATRLDWPTARSGWPERRSSAHKGDLGRVLVVGGDRGMAGAALLAAEAAARTGAGMVFLATRPEHLPACIARRPELIARGVDHRSHLVPLLQQASAVVVGPGLGQHAWGEQLLQAVIDEFDGPVLIDADGLNLLSAKPRALGNRFVLTPHPGEAARLLGQSVAAVERDRISAARTLAQRYGCTFVLKGAGSLVCGPDATAVPTLIHAGNAGMASAGMGDVLCGFIGALLGQGVEPHTAATLGATLHGAAADQAIGGLSMAGLLAGDLPLAAARLLAETEHGPAQAEVAVIETMTTATNTDTGVDIDE